MVYQSNAIPSSQEPDAWRGARSAGLLPADAYAEGLDDGHYISFFSEDTDECEAVNERILKGGPVEIAGTPQQPIMFRGWTAIQ